MPAAAIPAKTCLRRQNLDIAFTWFVTETGKIMFARFRFRELSVNRSPGRTRSGAATLEFAICMPMVLALVFGTIEAANAVFLQQALTVAAYEAGNIAATMGGNADTATAQANAILTTFRVKSATVSISPAVTANTPVGTRIVVSCSAQLGANSVTSWCIGNISQTATFTIPRL